MINHALHLFAEILPVFLIAIVASSLIDHYVSDETLQKIFGSSQGFGSVLMASFIGSLIPICTCGMIPLAIKLHEKGLKWPPLVAFLVAGNASSIPALILTAILGWELTALRFVTSVIFGVLVAYLLVLFAPQDFELELAVAHHHHDDCCAHKKSVWQKLGQDIWEISRSFLPWIIVAVLIATYIASISDTDLMARMLEPISNPLISAALASVIAFPFYFCAGADVPLSQEFLKLGLPIGTIISFMLASPGINLTSFLVYRKAVGLKLALIFTLTSILAAVMIGSSLWLLK
ncbi:MAG: permease [Candidatus Melainabacteria bacterium]|nr:permease [Candidatus Melainabacteria bacterium]